MKNILIFACFLAVAFGANAYAITYVDSTVCTGLSIAATVDSAATDYLLVGDCTADTTLSATAGYFNSACTYTVGVVTATAASTATAATKTNSAAAATTALDGFTTTGTTLTVGSFTSNVATITGWTTSADKDTWVSTKQANSATVNGTALTMLTCTASDSSVSNEVTLGLSALTVVLF